PQIRVWNAHTGKCLRTLDAHIGRINSAVFSHDGMQVLSASTDGTITICGVLTGKRLMCTFTGHADSLHSATFNHDSSRILSVGNDNTIKIWDTHTRKCLSSSVYKSRILSTACSHD